MAGLLERSWWALLVRGLATVLFGAIAHARPDAETLVLTFVVFASVDGIADVIVSSTNRKEGERWWLSVLRGLAGIAPAVLVLIQPQLGALRLLYIIAARALMTGMLDVIRAIRLRKEIEGEFLLILGGVGSALFGVMAFVRSGAGVPAVISLIAGYALFVGTSLMILALRMRRLGKGRERLSKS